MLDIKEEAKKYVGLMDILWRDLDNAIKLGGDYRRVAPRCIENYREAIVCLLKCYPDMRPDNFDLPFLKTKPIGDLSKRELGKWRRHVSYIRGYLDNFIKGRR